jgi:co-chaperonin GroES (HSP10)
VIRPLNNYVLVRLEAEPEKTGTVVLIDSTDNPPIFGIVLAVGPGRIDKKKGRRVPMEVQVGMRVCFMKCVAHTSQAERVNAIVQELDADTILIRDNDILTLEVVDATG